MLHHAYIILGNSECGIRLMRDLVQVDVAVDEFDNFGINEARALKDRQGRRVSPGERRVFALQFKSITGEAQNALLKVLEDPTPGVYLFFISPPSTEFLPTLISRCRVLRVEGSKDPAGKSLDVDQFLKLELEQRLQHIAGFLNNYEDRPAVARLAVLEFLMDLGQAWRDKKLRQDPGLLEELLRAGRFLSSRAGQPKLVLDHLALLC